VDSGADGSSDVNTNVDSLAACRAIGLHPIGTSSFDPVDREYLITIKGDQHDANGFNTRKQHNVVSKDLVTYSDVARMDGPADAIDAQG
jgi:hypothetical protein